MMIEFKIVSKRFGNKLVLDRINFSIKRGEIIFVLGKSGMGKSVTLKCIVGLHRPDSGEIWVDGKKVNDLKEEEFFDVRKACGMVFQYPALIDSLDVYENLAFGLRAHKICESEQQIEQRILEKLELVNLDASILRCFPPELSFGMQKRVSIARTLAVEPSYLLFDEPTTGLDPVATNTVNRLILKLSQKLNVTSIVVSHDMDCALDIADRIFLLDRGEIVEEGSPQTLLNSPHPIAKEFMREVEAKRLGNELDS